MPHRLVFTGKQQVQCEEFSLDQPAAGQVLVRSICSLMSTGTENTVFNRNFAPGTHWDDWVKYPFYPGYSVVGEVIAVGAEVVGFAVGDRVAHRGGHASHHLCEAVKCLRLPMGIDPRQAAWHALAKIAFVGSRAAAYQMGDSVLVIGAGPIGQMSLRWAKAAGAGPIAVADPMARRLDLARSGGANLVYSAALDGLGEVLQRDLGGRLPRIVVDTTGHPAVFAQALTLVRDRGRVVLLGDAGVPDQQHLTKDLITRGLTIVGAHDCHDDDGWNNITVARLFADLMASGRFLMDGLNTHVFDPRRCVEAYAEVNARRGETMGVLFDWAAAA